MYISRRSATLRNISVAVVNGIITLVILLIAPLGLAAVIINTILITFATYFVSNIADRIVWWLQSESRKDMEAGENEYSAVKKSNLQRWWR